MSTALKGRPDLLRSSPISPEVLDNLLTAYANAHENLIVSKARLERAKTKAYEALVTFMEWAGAQELAEENFPGDDQDTAAGAPGRPGPLKVVAINQRAVTLRWAEPRDGGAPTAYLVQSRARALREGWTTVVATDEMEVVLENQENGVELEYWVFAVNKAGHGPATDIVRMVL
ncbi:MAG: fibronectin type III domain-containing protein [Gemmatimonadetes bacterium]|nr:fibronectin type III domain-containing protein [Gemmatimonadota bacterium]